ncbi:MAG: hypothetical protein JNJ41_12470 [Bacteroidia bacterium]|nr:hypothetical protein [Bacteroidia bacterium]
MTLKKTILHALFSSVLAALAGIMYNSIYCSAFEINFKSVLNVTGIIGASIFGCVLMSIGYFVVYKWKGEKLIAALNILIAILSFASIVGVFGFQLPMEVESPELFPGLAVPMHFFPALSFFSLAPIFKAKTI